MKTKQAFSGLMSYFHQNKSPNGSITGLMLSITIMLYVFSEPLQYPSNIATLKAEHTAAANVLTTVFLTSNQSSTQEPSKQAT